jgi:hypothetical protein
MFRALAMAQKVRKKLGGSTDIFEMLLDKPKGMHWRTYDRLRSVHEAAKERAMDGLGRILERR